MNGQIGNIECGEGRSPGTQPDKAGINTLFDNIIKDGVSDMITTVTLNPCIDLTVQIPSLEVGGLNLVNATRTDISGKGVNVSLVLRELGLATMACGINFDGNGQQLVDFLEQNSIAQSFAMAHGQIRTNIKVVDESKKEMTELNHRGWPVEKTVINQFLENLVTCAHHSELVVLSGRIPSGADTDVYRKAMAAIKPLPVRTIVDAEGEPLLEAIEEKPYLIKPNAYELGTIINRQLKTKEDIVKAAREIIAMGVSVVCVSMGGEGAMIIDEKEAYFAPALDVDPKGFQGAGDSMVAGICKAIKEKQGIGTMLSYGIAAASGSIIREGTLLCRSHDFDRLLKQVELKRL